MAETVAGISGDEIQSTPVYAEELCLPRPPSTDSAYGSGNPFEIDTLGSGYPDDHGVPQFTENEYPKTVDGFVGDMDAEHESEIHCAKNTYLNPYPLSKSEPYPPTDSVRTTDLPPMPSFSTCDGSIPTGSDGAIPPRPLIFPAAHVDFGRYGPFGIKHAISYNSATSDYFSASGSSDGPPHPIRSQSPCFSDFGVSEISALQSRKSYPPIAPNPTGVFKKQGLKRSRSEMSPESPIKRRKSSCSIVTTELGEEDQLLLELKEQGWPWRDIALRFQSDLKKSYQIPALQMRYKRVRERKRDQRRRLDDVANLQSLLYSGTSSGSIPRFDGKIAGEGTDGEGKDVFHEYGESSPKHNVKNDSHNIDTDEKRKCLVKQRIDQENVHIPLVKGPLNSEIELDSYVEDLEYASAKPDESGSEFSFWTDSNASEIQWDMDNYLLASLRSNASYRLLCRYCQHKNNQEGSASAGDSNCSQANQKSKSSGNPQSTQVSAGGKIALKRKNKDALSDNEEDDDDDHCRNVRPRLRKPKTEKGRLLACPFCKFNPRRYRKCYRHIDMNTINRVKQHLLRCHQIPIHCPRCSREFECEESRDDHARNEPPCSSAPRRIFEGISPSLRKRLHRRVSPKQTIEENWYIIYEMLFPGARRPQSPYISSPLEEQLYDFQDFALSEGPSIIRELLTATPTNGPVQENDVEDFVQTIFQDAVTWACERYQAREAPDSGIGESQCSQPSTSRSQSEPQPDLSIPSKIPMAPSQGSRVETARTEADSLVPDFDSRASSGAAANSSSIQPDQTSAFEIVLPSSQHRPNKSFDSEDPRSSWQASMPSMGPAEPPLQLNESYISAPDDFEHNGFDWRLLATDLEHHPPDNALLSAYLPV